MSVISVKDLTKNYGSNKGIFDLNFEIEKGEVFGYLGPNGAGKTTTIRHLLGFLNPDKGECHIEDMNCRTHPEIIQKNLGYLAGEISFFDDMTGIAYLKFIAKMRGMKNFDKMNELINYFELSADGRIKKMSKGMKQKLGIVSAFMHNPNVLILDEPTSGLDPLMQNKFVELILKEKSEGKTILMSSHSFEEVERTCDRVGIIKEGRFVAVETVSNLKKTQRKVYTISFADEEDALEFAKEPLSIASIHKNKVQVAVKDNIKQFISALDRHPVTGIDVVSQSLEEVFMSYYGGENNV